MDNEGACADWLGEIPECWNVASLKRVTTRIQAGMTPPTDTPDYYFDGAIPWFAPGSYKGDIELRDPHKLINELARKEGALRTFPGGTVFLVGIGATIGKVGLVLTEASCNQQLIGIVCDRQMHSRYLAYQLKIYEEIIPGIASATTLPIFDQVSAGYLLVCLPPVEEQHLIATYLDGSCSAIDAAVDAKRRQIETLDALAESLIESAVTAGVQANSVTRRIDQDWVGEIPAHWDACRIKRVVARVDYGISDRTEPEGRFPVLKMGHIQRREIEFSGLDFVDEVGDDLLLENGDLLYNRTNSPDQVGKAAVFRGDKSDGITFASYLVRLRTNHRANPYYLNYLLNSSGFLAFARKLAIPSVQQSNLNSTRYCRMLIPLPPIPEQREITAFLDEKLAEVRRIVAGITAQIETLTAYRKSLIHECVTGQRRVTEEDLRRVCGDRRAGTVGQTS
jgi:type I restriction enzyme S subunit